MADNDSRKLQDAIKFVNKVKQRFGGGIVYKSFVDILNMYDEKYINIEQLYNEAAYLFHEHPDLYDDFTQFLPHAVASPSHGEGNMQQMPKIRSKL